MHVNKPTLHPMARAGLIEIQAAGVEITPDIVLWVQDAAEKIRKTPLRPSADLVDWPVSAGGALLYPLSFGAVAWLTGLPKRMQDDIRVIGYACAHSHDLKLFETLRHPLPASIAVMRWALTLKCSRDALSSAVDEALGNEEYVEVKDAIPRKRDPESVHWGAVIRALCTKYPGTTPSYWTWDVSRDYCYAMVQQISEELPDSVKPTDYEIESNAAFRSIVEHIKATAKEPANG
jgi:hypothetical protein